MRGAMALVAWLGLAAMVPAQQFAVEKFLDDQAFVVARIRPKKIELNNAIAYLTKNKVIPQAQAIAFALLAGTVKGSLDRNAEEIFVVYSMSMVASGEFLPLVAVPTKDAEQQEKLEEMLRKIPGAGDVLKTKRLDNALLAGSPGALERAARQLGKPRPDIGEAKVLWGDHAVQVAVVPTADQKRSLKELVPPLQKPLDKHSSQELAAGLSWMSFSMDPFPPRMKAAIRGVDAPWVEKGMSFIKDALQFAPLALSEADQNIAEPAGKLMQMIGNGLKKQGNDIVLELNDPQPILDLFAAAAAKARGSAQSMQSVNNMKQLLLAMHVHHDAKNSFPAPAIVSSEGKPLLSWRVAVLPYLEQEDLYRKFKLDEPWDSEHNRKLVPLMPKLFAPEGETLQPGHTPYVVPVGKQTMFFGGKGGKLGDVTDGTTNTVALIQLPAGRAVIWSKPDDLDADPKVAFDELTKGFSDRLTVGFGDGTVRRIKFPLKEEVFRNLLDKADGKPIPLLD
ncbi:MAG: DUF1559 domain-containing protein [Planctomycetes bacterium]|nr:DUF1559 domain-containing protein [Planctomycetota bacterium]